MPDRCPKCNQDFIIEPGFYFGAMYVSYALTIAINIAVFVVLLVFNIYSLTNFFIAAFFTLLISLPYIFKISRVIWMAMMVSYDPNAINNYETQHKNK